MGLVECVPNFSEGKDKAKVDAIVAAAKSVAGVTILDVETDADHNRCVLSFVAPPDAAVEACFKVAQRSRELIDLNSHKGEHPRMGAVDVIPFIPVSGVSIGDCVKLAERLAERIGRDLDIPAYLYDHAARLPGRKDLAQVRKGQFEGLRELIGKDPARTPDFGPNRIHPTAGAVAVGAREQIINFNLNLDAHDMAAGKDIARRLRASGGGLPAVRAKEIDLAARKQVQISTVLTDYKTTSMKKVIVECARLAAEHGAKIKTTEIVGLLPRQALVDFAVDTLTLENFNPAVQILENRLRAVGAAQEATWQKAGDIVAQALSNTDATPGGGSAAGIAGGMGCGLGQMAVGITLKSKKLDAAKRPALEKAHEVLGGFRGDFSRLTGEDAAAFDDFMKVVSLPKDDPARAAKMQEALIHAAEVPLATTAAAKAAYETVKTALPLSGSAVLSDMNCALHLLKAAALCAAENVRINLGGIKDAKAAESLSSRLEAALKAFLILALLVCPLKLYAADYDAGAKDARILLDRLVAADTTNPPGNEAKAVALGAAKLKEAGIAYEITEFAPGRRNLVARLKGSGQEKPLLLLAHLDVVGAQGQPWSTDPHKVTEKDGFLLGRGVHDDLDMAVLSLETLLMLKRSGAALKRDLIVAWTGDEESGGAGIQYLLKHKPESVAAELAFNEGGGPVSSEDGKVRLVNLQMAEKIYSDWELVARGPTGHSSVPLEDNAIYRLAAGLEKLGRAKAPARLMAITKAYFAARAKSETGEAAAAMKALGEADGALPEAALKVLEADPTHSATLRTTCVATLLSGGTRVNALPAEAKANVNCRILPDETFEDVKARLVAVLDDPQIEVRSIEFPGKAGPSPVEGPGPAAVAKVVARLFPGALIVPSMSRGATDSRYLREAGIAAYGINPVAVTEADGRRMHGIDERIPVNGLRQGLELLYELVSELAVR